MASTTFAAAAHHSIDAVYDGNRQQRIEGVVFPGEQSLRECCDLASGSAGVALFLDRVRHAAPGRRTNRNFLLDDLLTSARPAPGDGS